MTNEEKLERARRTYHEASRLHGGFRSKMFAIEKELAYFPESMRANILLNICALMARLTAWVEKKARSKVKELSGS